MRYSATTVGWQQIGVVPGNAQIEFVILGHAKPGIKSPHILEHTSAKQYRRDHFDEVALEQRFVMRRWQAFLTGTSYLAAFPGDENVVPYCHGTFRVLGENAEPGFDRIRLQTVVRIQKHNVAASALPNSQIAAFRQAAIGLAYVSHGKILRNFGASVRRPIVHNNDFDSPVGLRQGALDRLPKVCFAVVARNDNRDQRIFMPRACAVMRTIDFKL